MSNIFGSRKVSGTELNFFGKTVYGEVKAGIDALFTENKGTYSPVGIGNVATPNFTPRVKVVASEKKATYKPTFTRRPKAIVVRKPYEARGGFTFAQALESAII